MFHTISIAYLNAFVTPNYTNNIATALTSVMSSFDETKFLLTIFNYNILEFGAIG